MIRRARLAAAALLCAALPGALAAGCAGPDASSVLELKLGHVSSPGSLLDVTAVEFARRVNEALAGRARVSVFGSGQLGNDEVLLIKLRLGTVDFALPSTVMSSTVEAFGFFEMPYLVKDREHLKRIERAIFWPYLEPRARERGFRTLALWEHGFRQITNSVRPIVRPADLAGIKLRTPKGHWRVRVFQAFGANPTPMSLGEVFVALQTGVLDGQENPLPQIHASRFQEVQQYLSLTNHVFSPAYLMVGADRWGTHPPDIRATIERIAAEMQDYSYAEASRMHEALLASLRASGIQINEADRAGFIAASQRVYEEFEATVPGGRRWIEQALALEHATVDAQPD